ncbi:VTC domain-containing protein [Desulfopila sp. IMCC35008]|uniref:VTC domain-containing protein n=1 Tax=Desulfopila sp. IMCC35008 TaxID=2653858 RepID=UPI0013D4EC05|nr:VTC domain-containing protein [Desulfopila sp. IMCC35008]
MQARNVNNQIGEHETKFVFDNCRAKILRQWLATRCEPDPQYHEGIISSIYFDTRDFIYLHEKLSSDYLKTKVRLRWYSSFRQNSTYPSLFLEVKHKVGSARKKIRKQLPQGSTWVTENKLDSLEFHQVRDIMADSGILITKPLLPVFQITYTRTRYVEPFNGARISVDSDIHVPRCNPTLIPEHRTSRLTTAVFEYKNLSGSLPDYLHPLIALADCRKSSFSKYSTCYAQVKNIHF